MLKHQHGTFLFNSYTPGNLADEQVVGTFINNSGKNLYVRQLIVNQTVVTNDIAVFKVSYATAAASATNVDVATTLTLPAETLYATFNFTTAQKAIAIPAGAVVRIIAVTTGTVKPANLVASLEVA